MQTPLQLTERISLYITGMGAEEVRRGAEQLLAAGADALVSIGTAGALDPDLVPGTLLIPEKVIVRGRATYRFTTRWHSRVIENLTGAPLVTHTGNLAHSDSVLSSREEKSALYQKSQAVAVDMESAVIATLAGERSVPVLALRTVVDTAATVIPPAVLAHSDPFGVVRLPALFFSLLKRPGDITDFIRLARGFRLAAGNLRWLGNHIEKILLA